MEITDPGCGIALTGLGVVAAFGRGTGTAVIAAMAKRDGATTGEARPAPRAPCENSGNTLSAEIQQDRLSTLCADAIEISLKDAAISAASLPSERTGLILGSSFCGQQGMVQFADEVRAQSARFVSPIHFPNTVGNYAAGALARAYHLRGVNNTLACGGNSGMYAMLEAAAHLRAGEADVMLAGGTDVVEEWMTRSAPDGVEGQEEAAAWVVLETEARAAQRGAPVLGVLRRWRHDAVERLCPSHGRFIRSLSGAQLPGAICIDGWLGRTCSSGGLLALAAGLAAIAGQPVPISDACGPDGIRCGRIDLAPHRSNEGEVILVVSSVDPECGVFAEAEFVVPTAPRRIYPCATAL